jgi:hypothetical protein
MRRRDFPLTTLALAAPALAQSAQVPIDIGSRRELFLDHHLLDRLKDAELRASLPIDAGTAVGFDRPWEGAFSAYSTIVAFDNRFRLYYRGVPRSGADGNDIEVTCCADSDDGIHWTRPELKLFPISGAPSNNVVLAGQAPFSHNFSPFFDARPAVAERERFKALAGIHKSGLWALTSPDGLRWTKAGDQPVMTSKEFAFDSQNVSFWSAHEGRYVCFFRTWKKVNGANYRWISRASSDDFLHWRLDGEIDFAGAPPEHLYTNQASPYFRAPHIYLGICARFMPNRQVLNAEQAAQVGVDPKYYKDCSDAVLVSSRGGTRIDRTFLEAFLRPGHGWQNWVSRSNYPALNIIPTGAAEMSFYVNRNYGQPTAHLRRYALRLDGLAALHAGYRGGEAVTRLLRFSGSRLELNYATSAAGAVRVELQDPSGRPLDGFRLEDAKPLIGDETARHFAWQAGPDVSARAGKDVRVRFVLSDADIYSFRFC